MKCGLLGRKLGHSYSPQIHSKLGAYSYNLHEIVPENLGDFLLNGDYHGLNVTIPYKKDVIPYCTELSDTARRLGAVNTIVRRADGSLIGHNTDYFGFSSLLSRSGLQVAGKKVLVLGSGGASATVTAVLNEQNAEVVVISRSGVNNYDNLYLHRDASVIINTTPVGMYPNVGVAAVDIAAFPKLEGVIDVVYNPARTKILLEAEKRGLVAENGLWMLVAQAKESAQWFTGKEIPDTEIERIHALLRKQMENLILIGMPGCGKSTIGKFLAEKLEKTFVDSDEKIVEAAGCTIPEIFSTSGEDGFRRLETDVLAELGKQSGLVIATGGGCVTRPENYPALHQNGTIIWIQRDLEALPTDGRPLSQTRALSEMYTIREPLYEQFADLSVDNNRDISHTLHQITQWEESR